VIAGVNITMSLSVSNSNASEAIETDVDVDLAHPLVFGGVADIRRKPGANAEMLEWLDEAEKSKERIPVKKYSLLLKMLVINLSRPIASSELVKNLRVPPQVNESSLSFRSVRGGQVEHYMEKDTDTNST
jgi:hypothetical protein